MPIAHGEGRYTTRDSTLLKKLIANRQIIFRYSAKNGRIEEKFPTNPNGAMHNIAAVCSKKGNVMAIMPHPERAAYNWMVPDTIKNNAKTNAIKIFESMKKYIEDNIWRR